MLRRLRRATIAKGTAAVTAGLLAFSAGPWQGTTAVAAAADRDVQTRRQREARKLDLHELKAIRGSQIEPGGNPGEMFLQGGPPQPWGFSYPDLGGYGQIGGGNQHVAIPITAHGGRRLSFTVYYNSASVPWIAPDGPNRPSQSVGATASSPGLRPPAAGPP